MGGGDHYALDKWVKNLDEYIKLFQKLAELP